MAKGKLTLEAINQRLKNAKVGVTIRQKGNRLYLRATLPPKPGSSKTQSHQQDISLKIYANPAGLERAEAEAYKLGASLACKEFSWETYLPSQSPNGELTIGNLVEKFRMYYMATHKLEEQTWKDHWWNVYKRLPQDASLTSEILLQEILKTEADTRNRRQTCEKLQNLATFAELPLNFNVQDYAGSYSSTKTKERKLPDDETIVEWREKIPNPSWQWLYGILAAYGLRPHEGMFCHFCDDPNHLLKVTEGKTGPRNVYPLYPEWVERWQLWDIKRPNIHASTYKQYGDRICKALRKRYELPFVPYDLRHAYAVRASVVFKFPVAVAAAYMGHSPTVHWNLYNKWISAEQHAQEYERQMQRPDRPKAPEFNGHNQ